MDTRGTTRAWGRLSTSVSHYFSRFYAYLHEEGGTLFLISLAMVVVIVLQTFVSSPIINEEVIFLALYVATIFSLPLLRTGTVVILIALTCFGEFDSTLSAIDREWVLVVAMAILSLFKSPRFVGWASLIIFLVAAYDAYNAFNRYGDPTSRIYHFALGASCILIAAITVWNRQQQKVALDAHTKKLKMRHNVIAASMIHDAVSNNLSQIILTSGNAMEEASGADREKFKEIQDFAQQALKEVHSVIGFLDGSIQEVNTVPYMQMVEGIMKISDDHLHQNGYEGGSVIIGSYDGPCHKERQNLSLDVLHEIYVNIERHVDPRVSPYNMVIKLDSDSITIMQNNSTDHEDDWQPPVHSGVGMDLIKRRVEDMGGVMRTNVDEDEHEWHFYCMIPLSEFSNEDEFEL